MYGNKIFIIFYAIVICFLFIITCKNENPNVKRNIAESYKYSELLSYELSFGSEQYGTPNKYLLISSGWRSMDINSKGEFIIGDEYSIKVFDAHGKAIKIFGNKGQGPGAYEEESPELFISPNNYLTVINSSFYPVYTIYSPEYKFVNTERIVLPDTAITYIKEKTLVTDGNKILSAVNKVWAYNEKECVYIFRLNISDKYFVFCLYKYDNVYKPLFIFKNPNVLTYSWGGVDAMFSDDIGTYDIYIMNNGKIMYYTSEDDLYVSDTEGYYILHIVSVYTGEEKIIKQKYAPVLYPEPETLEEFYKKAYGKRYENKIKNMIKEEIEYCVKRKYVPSLEWISFDGNYIFAFQKRQYGNNIIFSTKENYDVDIFDMLEQKYIKTVKLSQLYLTIRYGYIYISGKDSKGYGIINKYKINPSVYGK